MHICKLCESNRKSIKSLFIHLSKSHSEFDKKRYWEDFIENNTVCIKCGNKISYEKFCFNEECNVKWNNLNNRRIQKAEDTICQKYESTARSVRQIKFWINKGFSELESKNIVSNIQKTFTLEKCIKKFGADKGYSIWENRQKRWIKTMSEKSFDEKIRINELRYLASLKNKFYSKNEIELCSMLDCKGQFRLVDRENKKIYFYDMNKGNKIIEYNGDYWHANPKFYKENDLIKYPGKIRLSAKEIWERDERKINFALQMGFKVLVVWEDFYKSDRNSVIDLCKGFISNE